MTKVKDVVAALEAVAPPVYQESYDNAGLIAGNPAMEVTGVLCCLDSVEEVLEEAIERGCNLIVAHHPIVFKGLKKITGRSYVERVVIKAIKHDLAIYAIHTNLDNVYHHGVNAMFAERLGLEDTRILSPKGQLMKLSVSVLPEQADGLRQALFDAGAGAVNGYGGLSSTVLGAGTVAGDAHAQLQLEVFFGEGRERAVLAALRAHGSEAGVPALQTIKNLDQQVGSGMVGQLTKAMKEKDFLAFLKEQMGAEVVRHTALREKKVKTVALCGGAGSFLLSKAIAAGADVFVTADYKYHEFFDADGQIVIADIGHYESEQFTIDLLRNLISQKFTTFAVYCTEVYTNPVKYFS